MAKKTAKKQPAAALEPVEPAPVGRPSSYDPDFTRQAEALCRLGATDQDLADFFAVSTRTINRWKVTCPEFVGAIRRAKEPADERVQDSLYHRAQDREVEEEQAIKVKKVAYGPDGKKILEEEKIEVVTVRKFIPADTTAMIFWLKNRRKQEWRDVQQHEHGKPGDFSSLEDQELDALILTEAKEVLQLEAPKSRGTKH